MVIVPGAVWERKEVTDALISNLKGVSEALVSEEGFTSIIATRRESPKMEVTKRVLKLKGPDDLLMGASGIDNLSFYKTGGDFQGSIVAYKDRLYFVSSLAFKLERQALAIKPEEKKAEMDKLLFDLKGKVTGAGLQFSGTLDSFSAGKATAFTKEGVLGFLSQVKSALAGLKLRAL